MLQPTSQFALFCKLATDERLVKGPFIIYTSGGHRREIGWVTDF